MSLEGKVAVVTGAGSGIGRAAARSLHAAGARVALFGRRKELLDETAASLDGPGGRSLVFPVDVADRDGVGRAIALARRPGAASTSSSTTPGSSRRAALSRSIAPETGTGWSRST
jgi:NAD(P)-dependent dehydrogenase (short-subunit alcohol dehydrogenase family)